MAVNISARDNAARAQQQYTTDFVISSDGTKYSYIQLGHGPGVVLMHGAMSSGLTHLDLAKALAKDFTVYVPDRRGRGASGPYGSDYSIQKDVEDVEALLNRTGTHNIFGVSSGGIICLQAALSLPAIQKAAIYEPPLFVDRPAPVAYMRRLDKELAAGKTAAALITGMKGAQMGPPVFNLMPRWLLEWMTSRMLAKEDKTAKGDEITWRSLAPTLHYDGLIPVEMSKKIETFRAIQAEVLLLGGSKSPGYLKAALTALAKIIPHATRYEFAGLGHSASWNRDRGGQPEAVAQQLCQFFTQTGM